MHSPAMKRCLGLLVVALHVAACKPNSGASLKTLENFASSDGSTVVNQCQGSYPLSGKARLTVDVNNRAALSALKASVQAVPPSLQRLFFEADGGVVLAVKSFEKDCKASLGGLGATEGRFFAGGLPESTGCVRLAMKEKSVVLQLKPDAKAIQHQFVRLFGLTYGRMYGPRRFKDWNDQLAVLSTAFVRDVAMSKGKFDLKAYEGMLSSAAGRTMFDQFVFGEAFDSYYCNAQTRQTFAKNFPATFDLFGSMAHKLEK